MGVVRVTVSVSRPYQYERQKEDTRMCLDTYYHLRSCSIRNRHREVGLVG